MKIIPGNAQHIGKRQEQQDAFGFSDIDDTVFTAHGGVVAVIADGMGGHDMGKESSHLAVHTFLAAYMSKSPKETVSSALMRSLILANDAVHSMAVKNHVENDSGTTLIAVAVLKNKLYFVSVGDSRIYLFRKNREQNKNILTCLTKDHVFANELAQLVEKGEISQKEADNHHDRNALTCFLGISELLEIDKNNQPIPIKQGDKILLCSDGLYGSLDMENINASLMQLSPQDIAETLVQSVLKKEKKYQDNLTIAILGIGRTDVDLIKEKKQSFFSKPSVIILLIIIFTGIAVTAFFGNNIYRLFFANKDIAVKEIVSSVTEPVKEPIKINKLAQKRNNSDDIQKEK